MVYVFMIKTLVILRCEPHRLLSFVTYSAAPARRLSFAEGSLKVWGILNFELGTSCKLAPAGVYFAI